MLGPLSPMLLQTLAQPFNHPDWLFELKYDGFRAFAFIVNRSCRLQSRNNHRFTFTTLSDSLAASFPTADVVLDGEIACVDERGRPQFNELLFRRSDPRFFAFDLLYYKGKDLRSKPLIQRKEQLKKLVASSSATRLSYADHLEENGAGLFEAACANDLEGIVAKHTMGAYVQSREHSTWYKIRNAHYSQMKDRHDLFEGKLRRRIAHSI